jgi:phage/plasmid-associated DNA primase
LNELTDEEELSGFLNKVLIFLTKIEEVGVTKTDKIEKAMQEWMTRANSIFAFVNEMVERDINSYVEKDKLYAAYTLFCSENDYPPKKKNIFSQELQRFIPIRAERKRKGNKRVHVWYGIKLKDVKPEDFEEDEDVVETTLDILDDEV